MGVTRPQAGGRNFRLTLSQSAARRVHGRSEFRDLTGLTGLDGENRNGEARMNRHGGCPF